MIWKVESPVLTKSSVFSLLSTATAITVKESMQNRKVVKNLRSMYQSIFFIPRGEYRTKICRVNRINSFGHPWEAFRCPVCLLQSCLQHRHHGIFPAQKITG